MIAFQSPYFYIYIFLFLLTVIEIVGKKKYSGSLFKLSTFVVFCFFALRSSDVGADTQSYVRFFLGKLNDSEYYENELLFLIYNNILCFVFQNEFFFMFVNTIVTLLPLYILIKKYSDYKVASVLLFFALGYIVLYMGVLRQSLALSFIIIGVMYVEQNRKKKWLVYAILNVCAYLMHNSMIIATAFTTILYFVPMRRRNIPCAIIIVAFILGKVLEILNISEIMGTLFYFAARIVSNDAVTSKMDIYLNDANLDTEVFIWIAQITAPLLGLVTFAFMEEHKINHWFSKLFLFSIIVSCLFTRIPMLGRLLLFSSIFSIVVVPWGMKGMTMSKKQINIILLFLFLFFISRSYIGERVYHYDVTDYTLMNPYTFFFEKKSY